MSNTKLINEAYKYVTPKAIEKSYFGDRAMSSYDRVNALRLMGVKDVPIAMGKQWQLLDQIGDTIKTQYDRLDTAPNDVRTQYAMASYLSQYLGMDYDYALSLTNKSAFAEKVGRKGSKGNAWEGMVDSFKYSYWQTEAGEAYGKYLATLDENYKRLSEEYTEKANEHRVVDKGYGWFGDMMVAHGTQSGSSFEGTIGNVLVRSSATLLGFIFGGGAGAVVGSKVGKWIGTGYSLIDAGLKQAGMDFLELSREADDMGRTLDVTKPVTRGIFALDAILNGTLEVVGLDEKMPGYKAFMNSIAPQALRKSATRTLKQAIKTYGVEIIESLFGESLEEFFQSLVSNHLTNVVKENENKLGANFDKKEFEQIICEASEAFGSTVYSMLIGSVVGVVLGNGANTIRSVSVNKYQVVDEDTSRPTGVINRGFINYKNKAENEQKKAQKTDEKSNNEEQKAEDKSKNTNTKKEVEKQPTINVIQTPQGAVPATKEDAEALEKLDEMHGGDGNYNIRIADANASDMDTEGSSNVVNAYSIIANYGASQNPIVTGTSGKNIIVKTKEALEEAIKRIGAFSYGIKYEANGTVRILTKDNNGNVGYLTLMTEEQANKDGLTITPFTQETDIQSYLNVTEEQASNMSQADYLQRVELKKAYESLRAKLSEEISDEVVLGGATMLPLLSKLTGKTIEDLLDNDIILSVADEELIKKWAQEQGIDPDSVGTGAIAPMTKDGKRVLNITLSKYATASTLLHELSHAVRMMATEEQMQGFAEAYGISLDQLMNEETWTQDNNALDERFANDLMVYLETGKAPTKELETFFAKVKQFIKEFIEQFKDKLSDETVKAFDHLFSADTQTTEQAVKSEQTIEQTTEQESVREVDNISEEEANRLVKETEEADNVRFEVDKNYHPKKVGSAFKLVEKNLTTGEYFPLFIGSKTPMPLGDWLIAQNLPTKGFARRPGYHLGAGVPDAPWLKNKKGDYTTNRGKNYKRVWMECEYVADVSYQEEAEANTRTHDLPDKLPKDGYYTAWEGKRGEWVITGAMRMLREVPFEEIDEILKANNYDKEKAFQTYKNGFDERDKTKKLKEDKIQEVEKNGVSVDSGIDAQSASMTIDVQIINHFEKNGIVVNYNELNGKTELLNNNGILVASEELANKLAILKPERVYLNEFDKLLIPTSTMGKEQRDRISQEYGIEVVVYKNETEKDMQLSQNSYRFQMKSEAEVEAIQARKKAIKNAVKSDEWVDTKFIEEFADEKWAGDELLFRQWLRENAEIYAIAKESSSFEDFLTRIKGAKDTENDKVRKRYLERIYKYAHRTTSKQRDKSFLATKVTTDESIVELASKLDVIIDGLWRGEIDPKLLAQVAPEVMALRNKRTAQSIKARRLARQKILANPRLYRRLLGEYNEEVEDNFDDYNVNEDLQNEIERLSNDEENNLSEGELNEAIEMVDKAIEDLKDEKFDSEEQLDKAIADAKDKAKAIQEEHDVLEKKNKKLESKIRAYDKFKKKLDEIKDLTKSVKNLEKQVRQGNRIIAEQQKKLEKQDAKHAKKVKSLEKTLDKTKQELKAKKKELRESLKSRKELFKDYEKAREIFRKLYKRYEALRNEYNERGAKIRELKDNLDNANKRVKKIENAYVSLHKKFSLYKTRTIREKLINQIKKSLTFRDNMDASFAKSFAWVKNLFDKKDREALKEERRKLYQQIIDINEQYQNESNLPQDAEDKIKELYNEIKSLDLQIEATKAIKVPEQLKIYFGDMIREDDRMSRWSLNELYHLFMGLEQMAEDARIMYKQKQQARTARIDGIARRFYKQTILANRKIDAKKDKTKQGDIEFDENMTSREIVNDIINNSDMLSHSSKHADRQGKRGIRFYINGLYLMLGKQSRLNRVFDGYQEGVMYEYFTKEAWQHQREYQGNTNTRIDRANTMLKKFGLTAMSLRKNGYTYTKAGKQIKLSRSQMIGVYVYSQSELGLEKLTDEVKGNGLSAQDIKSIIASLTENEKKWGDYMIEEMSSRYDAVADVFYNVYNQILGERERYFPLIALDSQSINTGADLLSDIDGNPVAYTDKGFTKKVQPRALYQLNLDVTNQLAKQIKRQENFIAFAEWTRDAHNLMGDTQADGALGKILRFRYGDNAFNMTKDYINELAHPKRSSNLVDSLYNSLLGKYTASVLTGNISTTLKQFAADSAMLRGDVNFMGWFNATFGRKIHFNDFSQANKELDANSAYYDRIRDFIYENAPELKNRRLNQELEDYHNTLPNNTLELGIKKINDKINHYTQNMVDSMICNRLWLACYYTSFNNAKAQSEKNGFYFNEKKAHDEACFEASQLIAETQNTIMPMDKNAFQRDAKNAFQRAVLLFTNQTMNIANQYLYDLPYAIHNRNWRKVIGTIANTVLSASFCLLVSAVFFRRPDEEDEEYKARMLKDIGKQFLSDTVPVLGNTIGNWFDGYSTDFINIGGSIKKIVNELKSDNEPWDIAKTVIGILAVEGGRMLGAPTTMIQRSVQAVVERNPYKMINSGWGAMKEED